MVHCVVMWWWGPDAFISEGVEDVRKGLGGGTLVDRATQDPRGVHAVSSSRSSLFLRTKAACLSWNGTITEPQRSGRGRSSKDGLGIEF